VFDLSANGWGGAVKEVVPASEARKIKVPELVADRSGIQKKVA
jgi:hypothetical protein